MPRSPVDSPISFATSAPPPLAGAVADALFSVTQQRVLGLLFGQPDSSFYATEIIARVRGGSGAVQRELARLVASGLVSVREAGRQRHYRANAASPIFEELCAIARKTLTPEMPARVLHEPRAAYVVERPVAPRVEGQKLRISQARLEAACTKFGIERVSVFGSAARNQLTPESDVDLLVEFGPDSDASLLDYAAMQDAFSAAFGGRRVDIATSEILRNPYRRKSIEEDLKLLYAA